VNVSEIAIDHNVDGGKPLGAMRKPERIESSIVALA
jgi:hypothetical protein